jgi:acyl carrier protein
VPTSSSVREELTDILVRVVGCPADTVVPEAKLKDLGTDSLTIVEVGEELGRRFDIYLSDDTIDTMATVRDAINAVVTHQPAQSPAPRHPAPKHPAPKHPAPRMTGAAPIAPAERPTPARRRTRQREHDHPRMRAMWVAIWLGIVGGVVGLVVGLGGATLLGATGMDKVDLPPLTIPTTAEPSTTTPSPTPTPTGTDDTAEREPTLFAAKDRVGPGERFGLSGAFPELGKGVILQVQVKDRGGDWDDFPIQVKTGGGGKFETQIYTSRTGERKFRMIDKNSGQTSPIVTVEIG